MPIVKEPRTTFVCDRCLHGWDFHSFVGRKGGKPAELRCYRCGCVIKLPSRAIVQTVEVHYP